MIIRQEETSPVSDLFYGLHLCEAMSLAKDSTETICVDTSLLKEACEATQEILKDYVKKN